MLEVELQASHILGKHSTTKLNSQPTIIFKTKNKGAGEMAQKLRVVTALVEYPGSVPSIHIAHTHLE